MRRGQTLVGRLGVRPQGVAAGLGDHDGVEDGAQRRRLHEGDVGVPVLPVVVLGSGAAHEGAGFRVVDLEDLLVVLEPGDDGVGHGDLAEERGEFLVLLGGEVLAGEEDDLVVEEGLPDRGQRFGIERLVEVDVADLGADRARQGRDVELDGGDGGHEFPLRVGRGGLILTKSLGIVKYIPSRACHTSSVGCGPVRTAVRKRLTTNRCS